MRINAAIAKRPRVEMLPLIDMFFILLAFFIFGVFSMTMREGIVVDLPSAETAESQAKDSTTISITENGELFFNDQPINQKVLALRLHELGLSKTIPDVTIRADAQVAHGIVVGVLDLVRKSNIKHVSFQTEHGE